VTKLRDVIAERTSVIVGHQIRVIVAPSDVEVVSVGIHLILIRAPTIGQERTDISIMLECPAVTNKLHINVNALLGKMGLYFLDCVAYLHFNHLPVAWIVRVPNINALSLGEVAISPDATGKV